jgi:hypothetical protein
MALQDFVKAVLPEPVTVFGLALKPFSIGHHLLMSRFGCGFVNDSPSHLTPKALIEDAIWGAVICSMTFDEFLGAVKSDKLTVSYERFGKARQKTVSFRKWLKRYGVQVTKAFRRHAQLKRLAKSVDTFLGVLGFDSLRDFVSRFFAKRLGRFTDSLASVSLFRSYLKDATSVPLFWIEDETPSADSGGHWTQGVLNVLTGELGYTHSEALNLPLAQAFSECLKASERKGSIRLMTEDEVAEVKRQGGI